MEIVVLTPDFLLKDEAKIVNKLFEAGLDLLHIRKPSVDLVMLRDFITSINKAFHNRIIIHQHTELMSQFKLAGIHVKTSQFRLPECLQGTVSTSIHSQAEFELLDRPESRLFLSPVFNSISKKGYMANPNLLAVGNVSRKGKLVALGGINWQNIQKVQKYGFDGAALLGYIWESDNPLKRFLHIKNLLT